MIMICIIISADFVLRTGMNVCSVNANNMGGVNGTNLLPCVIELSLTKLKTSKSPDTELTCHPCNVNFPKYIKVCWSN